MTILDDAHKAFQAERDMDQTAFNKMMESSMDGYTDAEREYGLGLSDKRPDADIRPRDGEFYDTMDRRGSAIVSLTCKKEINEFED